MPITDGDKLSLQRFGCALQTSPSLLHVDWMSLSREQALAATVLVGSTHRQCVSGPALCLALEISPTRALPRYCYFVFNLVDSAHMDYLSRLLSAGNSLSIDFLGRDFEVERQHKLTSPECEELRKSSSEAKSALSTAKLPYNFAKITEEFESIVRIPHLFERVVSEAELARILPLIDSDREKIPAEKRALGRALVREFADSLLSHWEGPVKKGIAELPQYRDSFTLLLDIRRIFANDYDGFINFLGDAVAFNTDQGRLIELKKWAPNVGSIVKVLNLADSASPDKKGIALRDLGEAALALLNLVRKGRVLSLSMLQTLIPPLKPLLPSQPGRPVQDYSREYEWKKSMSWAHVTRRSLAENDDIREEFQGRTYETLSFEHQQSLMNRIREGVRSYAKRTGKPFPIENVPE
jgi:hypothetical protein